MVIDFSKRFWPEKPILVLQNPDGTPLQTLGFAYGLECDFCFNEISTIEFNVPRYVNGEAIPGYDLIVGLREVAIPDVGVFILTKPKTTGDGVHEIKHCTAYSRDSEWLRKKMSLKESTYQFWNPIAPDNTLLGILMNYMPSWSVDYVSSSLLTAWRNLASEYTSVYDFVKNTVQKTYKCIFDFNTAERKVSVYATDDTVLTKGVFLSTDNLVKELEIEEDTEHIITSLDVNGAEGVDIRAVNPMGTNKIYNLDYLIQAGMVPDALAAKWALWKAAYENAQLPFYNLVIDQMLKTGQLLTEQAKLTELRDSDLATLQNTWSVQTAFLATLTDTTSQEYISAKAAADATNTLITAKKTEISLQQGVIDSIQDALDDLAEDVIEATHAVQFYWIDDSDVVHYNFGFTADDLLLIDRLLMEDSIEESSFVLKEVSAYSDAGVSGSNKSITLSLSTEGTHGSQTVALGTLTEILNQTNRRMFSADGGHLTLSGDVSLSAQIIDFSAETRTDNQCVVTVYLGNGTLTVNDTTTEFPSGCLSLTGAYSDLTTDVATEEPSDELAYGTSLSFSATGAAMYFTQNTTQYETYSVQWDLYQFGVESLRKLAWPSYSFTVDAANFLTLDAFAQFASELTLGKRIYLDTGSMGVLTPILVKVHRDYDDPSKLTLEFGSTFNLSDSAFKLADLLDQSVSTGKTVDTSRLSWDDFRNSNTKSVLNNYMNNSLDLARQGLFSSDGMEVTMDSTGLWLRKQAQGGGYADQQIGMVNNGIFFTRDNFSTVSMAIGTIKNPGGSGYLTGVVGDALVGRMLVGQDLWIESDQLDGDVMLFRVNSTGAQLHNAGFSLYDATATGAHGRIEIDPLLGIVGGLQSSSSPLFTYDPLTGEIDGIRTTSLTSASSHGSAATIDDVASGYAPDSNFWIDMNGDVWLNGKIHATDSYFSGTVYATDGEFTGTVYATDGKFSGELDTITLKVGGTEAASITLNEDEMSFKNADGDMILYFDPAKETFVFDGLLGANAVYTDSLYAEQGYVADLTVNKLDTGNYISRYLTRDIADLNHIQITTDSSGLPHVYLTTSMVKKASVATTGYERLTNAVGAELYWTDEYMTETTTTATAYPAYIAAKSMTNPYGETVYWSEDISNATITDGYPYIDGVRVYTTTENTGYPVTIWDYNSQAKTDLTFCMSSRGYYEPRIILGAGDRYGSSRGYIYKGQNGIDIVYDRSDEAGELALRLNDSGGIQKALTDNGVTVQGTVAGMLIFENISVAASDWELESTPTFATYPYAAELTCAGANATMGGEVIFSPDDISTGSLATAAQSGSDTVTIYATEPMALTVLRIELRF